MLKNFKNFFSSISYEIDLFKSPFLFQFSPSRDKISTSIGIFFSLLIFVILFFSFIRSDMIQKINPSVILQTKVLDSPPKLMIENSIFQINMGIYDMYSNIYPIDPTILTLSAVKVAISDNNDLPKTIEVKTINMSTCNEYLNYNQFCVMDDLDLDGYVDKSHVTYFFFQLNFCDNTNISNNCKSEKEISDFLYGKVFAVSYNIPILDLNNYQNPIHYSNRTEWILLDTRLDKTLSVFLKGSELIDDDGYYFKNAKINTTVTLDQTVPDYIIRNTSEFKGEICRIIFFSSPNLLQNSRIYQKLDQVLANMSGLANFILIVGFLFVRFQTKLKFQTVLMRDLYENNGESFEADEDINRIYSELSKKNEIKKCLNQDVEKTKQTQETNVLVDKTSGKINPLVENEIFYLERYSVKEPTKKEIKNEPPKFPKLNIFQYCCLLIKKFFKWKLTENEILFLQIEKEFEAMTNLKYVIKLLTDLEKMKVLVFNKNQLKIFERLANPLKFIDKPNSDKKWKLTHSFSLSKKFLTRNHFDSVDRKSEMKVLISNIEKRQQIEKLDYRMLKFLLNK